MLRSVLCLPFFPISKIDRHPKSLTLLCCLLCLPPFFSHFQNRRSLPVPFAHLLRLVQEFGTETIDIEINLAYLSFLS
ncbi:hypothetical protein ERO13_D06G087150v2 [Gossypium hirsutum]|nr:hypothetical protein ERO13_D06G087150v2 [Gossypium hirsutum]